MLNREIYYLQVQLLPFVRSLLSPNLKLALVGELVNIVARIARVGRVGKVGNPTGELASE
jgi:hypothetical protein